MTKTAYRLLLIFLSLVAGQSPITVLQAQDLRPDRPAPLPFQQNAPQPGNEEQLAIQFYQNRDYDKAAELFERLYQKKPGNNYYQYLLFCRLETGDFDKAEKLIRKQQKAEPGALRYQVDMGYLRNREGNTEKARKIFEEVIRELSPNQQQVIDLANTFIARGEYEWAIKTYLRGRELLGNTYPFAVEMAAVYERMGDFSSVMEQYLDLLEINPSYLKTVQDRLQMVLSNDINNEKNERFRKVLLSRVQHYPDKTWYAELLWWYSIQQKDFQLAFVQAKALDRRLREDGTRLADLAALAVANEDYQLAVDCYQYLISRGPSGPFYELGRRELINTRYRIAISEPSVPGNQLEILEKELKEAIGETPEDPENVTLIRNLAHLDAFYLKKPEEATELLEKAITIVGISPLEKAECKLELADILLLNDDVWEATLLYQQVYKEFRNDVMGQEAKFRNAMLSFYIGEFKWAQAQADILKASTSRLIANDAIALSLLISESYDPDSNTVALGLYARADLLNYRLEPLKAYQTLDSLTLLFPDHPILQHVLLKKALIAEKMGWYAKADSLCSLLKEQYPDGVLADEAIMENARINERFLNNKERAMALYQELMEKYPGSIFVQDARKRFRYLRGDGVHD